MGVTNKMWARSVGGAGRFRGPRGGWERPGEEGSDPTTPAPPQPAGPLLHAARLGGSVNTLSFKPHYMSWVGLLSQDHILPAAERGGGGRKCTQGQTPTPLPLPDPGQGPSEHLLLPNKLCER